MKLVKKGQKFVIIQDFSTSVSTTWAKPCTGSEDCIIPKGTIVVAISDQLEGYPGFGVRPEKYKEIESLVVPRTTLDDKYYTSYYFVFNKSDFGKYFVYLDD